MSKKRILLVEDQHVLAITTQCWLEDTGYEVTHAENGREATKVLKQDTFDYIITDLIMPELDGVGLLKWLVEKNITTPVIVLTGLHNVTQSQTLGEFDNIALVVEKPLTPELLVSIQHTIDG